MRHPAQMSQQWDTIQRLPSQSLIPMYDGVNVVSNCAWTVNKPVSPSVCLSYNYLHIAVLLSAVLSASVMFHSSCNFMLFFKDLFLI